MGRIVLKYGLIAGLIIVGISGTALAVNDGIDMQVGEIVGWTTMLLALTFVYVGIRSLRMQQEDQRIGFGQAFLTGLLITLIATVFWAGGWEVYVATSDSNFYEAYYEHKIQNMEDEGAPTSEIEAMKIEKADTLELVKNPFIRFGFSSMEILLVGLPVSLIAGFVESRRNRRA